MHVYIHTLAVQLLLMVVDHVTICRYLLYLASSLLLNGFQRFCVFFHGTMLQKEREVGSAHGQALRPCLPRLPSSHTSATPEVDSSPCSTEGAAELSEVKPRVRLTQSMSGARVPNWFCLTEGPTLLPSLCAASCQLFEGNSCFLLLSVPPEQQMHRRLDP